jgi:hypothetical protein
MYLTITTTAINFCKSVSNYVGKIPGGSIFMKNSLPLFSYVQTPIHVLRRNCLLRYVIEGKIKGGIEVTGRRGRRRRKLLDELKEMRGYSRLKEEPVTRAMWRAGFGRGFGYVVRQTAIWSLFQVTWNPNSVSANFSIQ